MMIAMVMAMVLLKTREKSRAKTPGNLYEHRIETSGRSLIKLNLKHVQQSTGSSSIRQGRAAVQAYDCNGPEERQIREDGEEDLPELGCRCVAAEHCNTAKASRRARIFVIIRDSAWLAGRVYLCWKQEMNTQGDARLNSRRLRGQHKLHD